MATIQVLDQRDTQDRVVIVLTDLADEIDVEYVQKLSRDIRNRLLRGVNTLKSKVTIDELRQAVADGVITNEQFLQLLDS